MHFHHIRFTLAAAIIGLAPAAGSASVSNDQVQSQHIREADGTSGQATNSGAGVKTGHIQDAAVTGAKIAPAAVGAAQLADGAVNGAKIADGAITDAKISGTLSAARIEPGVFAPAQARVVLVAEAGGHFQTLAEALAWIAGEPGGPFVIRVAPGTFTVNAPVVLPDGVHLEGSGEGVTTIAGAIADAGSYPTIAVVSVSSTSELRFVSVVNDGTGFGAATAIINAGGKVTHVTATAVGAGTNTGIYNRGQGVVSHATVMMEGPGNQHVGIFSALGSSARIEDSKIWLSGAAGTVGIQNYFTSTSTPFVGPIIRNTHVRVSGTSSATALFNYESSATVQGCILETRTSPWTYGITNYDRSCAGCVLRLENSAVLSQQVTVRSDVGSGATPYLNMVVANSQLGGGGVLTGNAPMKCFNTYDDGFNPLACPMAP